MTNLSPAAEAVYDAFICTPVECETKQALAAAMRAAADQLKNPYAVEDCDEFERGFKEAHILYCTQFLTIAAELEALDD